MIKSSALLLLASLLLLSGPASAQAVDDLEREIEKAKGELRDRNSAMTHKFNTRSRDRESPTLKGLKVLTYNLSKVPESQRQRLLDKLLESGVKLCAAGELLVTCKRFNISPLDCGSLSIGTNERLVTCMQSGKECPDEHYEATLELRQHCLLARNPKQHLFTTTYEISEMDVSSSNLADKLDKLVDMFVIDVIKANSSRLPQ